MKHLLWSALLLGISATLSAAPLVAGPNEAFVLLNNTAVYKEKGLGILEWAESLTIGDKVTLLSGIVKMKLDGREREYFKVKLPNAKEGYVRTILLGQGGTLGVVKAESSFVYSEPREVKITERTLSRAQMVVVIKEGSVDPFIKVVGYDAVKDLAIVDSFVSKEDVSVNDVDANAVILWTVAKAQKNETLKKNLLTVASTKYATSIFMDLIKAQLGAAAGPVRATKPATGTFVLTADKVNVRDLPNEKGSKVVASLDKGAMVEVVEVTTEPYTIEGVTAPWYKLQEPAGWVFGSFLAAP